MQVITIAGAKGGTGKTTTAITVASELATGGLRVAIADCDPQASATIASRQKPLESPLKAEATQLELSRNSAQSLGDTGAGCLWLLRSGRPLATASKADIRRHLKGLEHSIDVLVVDTPPTIGPITLAAIEAADLIIVPLQPASLPVAGMFDLLRVIAQVNPAARQRLLLTMVKSRRSMTGYMAERIEATVPGLLYKTSIPDDAQCERAVSVFKPVTLFDRRSAAAVAYRALVAEIECDLGFRTARATADADLVSSSTLPLFQTGGSDGR